VAYKRDRWLTTAIIAVYSLAEPLSASREGMFSMVVWVSVERVDQRTYFGPPHILMSALLATLCSHSLSAACLIEKLMVPQLGKELHAVHGARISLSWLQEPLPFRILSHMKQCRRFQTLYSTSLAPCTLGHPASLCHNKSCTLRTANV
jgi:hypothetical protein